MKRILKGLLLTGLLLGLYMAILPDRALAIDAKSAPEKIVATDHQKYSYSEMTADIKQLTKRYPGKVSNNVIGKSEDGRDIYDVVLGDPNANKSILVVAAIHAREYMTSLLCMRQIEYYLQNYSKKIDGKKVKNTLNNIAIHYIPMANPDGVSLSQFGIKRIRSATLRIKLRIIRKGYAKYWKANARGVNLNANFPILFKKQGKLRDGDYTGPYACSERESRAIDRLVKKLKKTSNLKGIINYHATGSIIFGGCTASKYCKRMTTKMYKVAKQTTDYINADDVYDATTSGSFRAYVMHRLNIPSITIEVGTMQCPAPIREFPSIWRKNKYVVLREARIFS